MRFIPVEKCPSEGGGPLELKVGYEGGLDLQRLFSLDVEQNYGAGLVHRNKKRFAHGEIVTGIDERCGFRVHDQSASQALSGNSAAIDMKSQVEAAKDLQGIDPGFHFSTFVAEQPGAHSDYRKKFPRADGAGKFERLRRRLGGNSWSRDKHKAQ